jgi:hypothetical protein
LTVKTFAQEGLCVILVAVFLIGVVRFSGNDDYGIVVLLVIGTALAFVVRHLWCRFRPPRSLAP